MYYCINQLIQYGDDRIWILIIIFLRHRQLVDKLKVYIISDKIKVGERLPSVRELAMQLKVNPNTVQRALGELENLKSYIYGEN